VTAVCLFVAGNKRHGRSKGVIMRWALGVARSALREWDGPWTTRSTKIADGGDRPSHLFIIYKRGIKPPAIKVFVKRAQRALISPQRKCACSFSDGSIKVLETFFGQNLTTKSDDKKGRQTPK
jgi:hypothetical protein